MAGDLDDSWVEAESETEEAVNLPGKPSPKSRGVRKRSKATKSPEPQLVMPSLDPDTLEASWADNTRRATKSPKKAPVRKRPMHRTEAPSLSEDVVKNAPRKQSVPQESGPNLPEVILAHLGTILIHAWDILGTSLRMLKWPLSVALAGLILMWGGQLVKGLLMSSMYTAMAPLCALPGSSFLGLPFCPSTTSYSGATAEFDQLMAVQDKFEDVLKETAVGVTLPIDMKRSEASIRDLRQLVKYSHLRSREELGFEFDHFVDTAKIASNDLGKFNSHIGRAVDHVISISRWTLRVIDGEKEHEASRGSIVAFTDRMLAPFQAQKYSERALLDQYVKHAEIVEEQLHKLIAEAQAILIVLNNLEDRLDVIHGIVARDNSHIAAKKEEILADLWTLVGGNKGKLGKMESQLALLNQVNMYRNTAYVHVSLTVLKLQEIAANLEDLRERVGAPGNLGNRLDVPLQIHLDNIMMGIQRLEDSRDREKKVEKLNLDRVMRGSYADIGIEGS